MLAIDEAKQLYAAHGLSLALELGRHLDFGGVVHVDAERLLIGRPIVLADPDVWPQPGAADAWYVTLAVGRGALPFFIRQMPYFLPFIAWRRGFHGDQSLRIFHTERIRQNLLR